MGDPSEDALRPLSGLRVLAVSPTPTHPTTAGNRARLLALLDRLRSLGATIRLVHVRQEPGDLAAMQGHWSADGAISVPYTRPPERYGRWNRIARLAKRLRVPLTTRTDVDDWCDPALNAVIQEEVRSFQPHAVLMVYIWFSSILESLPRDVLRVLDSQDVFTDRAERMKRSGIDQPWFSVRREEEARGLSRFDSILAIQEREATHYRELTSSNVVTVGHFLPRLQTGAPSTEPRLLIVASNNPVNIDGVTWFIEAVWPHILGKRPDAMLHVVGNIADAIIPQPGVAVHGVVQHLDEAYSNARFVVNPLRGGTGLKIKGAEALAAGRAVVSTSSAAIGLEEAIGRGIVIADGVQDMVDSIIRLLDDDREVAELGVAARAFAEEWNAKQESALREVFSRALSPQRPA